MVDQNPEDNALNVDSAPTFKTLADAARAVYQKRLKEIESLATPGEIAEKRDNILDALRYAEGLPGVQSNATALAYAACLKMEQSGQGRPFYHALLGLYGMVSDCGDPAAQAALLNALIHHKLYAGQPEAADGLLRSLFDLCEKIPSLSILEALISFVSAAIIRNGDDGQNNSLFVGQILNEVKFTGDRRMIGRVYSLLAQLYTSRNDCLKAREYALKAFRLGVEITEPVMIANGLHYMGFAYLGEGAVARALVYLRMALAQNRANGDVSRIPLVELTIGTCYYKLGQYHEATGQFLSCLPDLKERGHYHAQAYYYLGLTLIQTGYYTTARAALELALDKYRNLKMPFDALLTKHALAYLAWHSGDFEEAVKWGKEALAEAESLVDGRMTWFLPNLKADVEQYRKAARAAKRKAAASKSKEKTSV